LYAIILLIGFGADTKAENNYNNNPNIYDWLGAFFGLLIRYVADLNYLPDGEPGPGTLGKYLKIF